jgi:ferredoxin
VRWQLTGERLPPFEMNFPGGQPGLIVVHDTGRCISSGMCLGTAPGQFRFDESQHSSPVRALTEPDAQVRDVVTEFRKRPGDGGGGG